MKSQPIHCSDRFCIIGAGDACFALPAASVREVASSIPLVDIPLADGAIFLCHWRNEFLPVVPLRFLLNEPGGGTSQNEQLLLLSQGSETWALLVDQVIGLERLEPSYNTSGRSTEPAVIVMGSASFRDQIVRILDPQALYRLAETSLARLWETPMPGDSPATVLTT